MTITEDKAKRCGIFLYYDKDGIVDEYVLYLVKSLRPFLKNLLIVCNGPINEKGTTDFKSIANEVLIRKNEGFDVGGYREGIFHIGLDELARYDEVILFNYTFFGPLYPFEEMFAKMNSVDVDFWGITKHHKVDPDPFGANRYGYLPEHIQSHFMVLRNTFVKSDDYRTFITELKNPTSYLESILDYETIFTKHFADKGYKWDVYVDTDEYEGFAYSPVMFCIKDLIEKKRCPIIKRRSFFTDYNDFLLNSCGESTVEAYDYILENVDYDTNMIWDNLLRLENMTQIGRAMQLNYMLPVEGTEKENKSSNAVYCYVQSTKHLDEYAHYLNNLTSKTDLILFCENGKIQENDVAKYIIRDYAVISAKEFSQKQLLGKIAENEGAYEYACMITLGDVEKAVPYSNFVSLEYRNWENILPSADYVDNVINTFKQNQKLGMLIPPIPNHGDLFAMIGKGWKGKFEHIRKMLTKSGIKVSINENDETQSPFGGSMWIRTKAIENIDFVSMSDDEAVLMAMPYLIQDKRFYTGVVYSNKYAAIEITNQDTMLRDMNKVVFEKYGPNYHKIVVDRIVNNETVSKANQICKTVLPNKVYKKFFSGDFVSKVNIALRNRLPENIYRKIEKTYVKIMTRKHR